MATEKQIAANRRNAARSTGPRTPEGKAISAQNSRRATLLGHTVPMDGENRVRFERFLRRFYREYQPQGPSERTLIDLMAIAAWRLYRVISFETAFLDLELGLQHDSPAEGTPLGELSQSTRASLAWRTLSDRSHSFDHLHRHEARLHREFHSAWDRLRQMRRDRKADDSDQLVPPLEELAS